MLGASVAGEPTSVDEALHGKKNGRVLWTLNIEPYCKTKHGTLFLLRRARILLDANGSTRSRGKQMAQWTSIKLDLLQKGTSDGMG